MTQFETLPEIINVGTIASYLRVTRMTITRLTNAGEYIGYRHVKGQRRSFKKSDLKKFLEAQV